MSRNAVHCLACVVIGAIGGSAVTAFLLRHREAAEASHVESGNAPTSIEQDHQGPTISERSRGEKAEGASRTLVGEDGMDRGMRRSVAAALPAVAELSARLASLKEAGTQDRHAIRRTLEQLVAHGTPEAIGEVLAAMEDPELDFSHRAETFARVLAGVVDERIQQTATRVLDRNMFEGLDTWVHTKGYIDLIGQKGGRSSADKLLELLGGGSAQVRSSAAEAVAALDDRSLASDYLSMVETGEPGSAMQLAASLASWREPATSNALHGIAEDPTRPDELRRSIHEALGRNFHPAEVAGCVSAYWSSGDEERALLISGIFGAASSDFLDSTTKVTQLTPVLRDALGSADRVTRLYACYSVEYNEAFHTEEMLALLEAQLQLAVDAESRGPLRDAIAAIRRSL